MRFQTNLFSVGKIIWLVIFPTIDRKFTISHFGFGHHRIRLHSSLATYRSKIDQICSSCGCYKNKQTVKLRSEQVESLNNSPADGVGVRGYPSSFHGIVSPSTLLREKLIDLLEILNVYKIDFEDEKFITLKEMFSCFDLWFLFREKQTHSHSNNINM